jgi:hypothetical protein
MLAGTTESVIFPTISRQVCSGVMTLMSNNTIATAIKATA